MIKTEENTRQSQICNLFNDNTEMRKKALEYVYEKFIKKIMIKVKHSLPPNKDPQDAANELFVIISNKYKTDFLKYENEEKGYRFHLDKVGQQCYFRRFLMQEMTFHIGKLWRRYYKKEKYIQLDYPEIASSLDTNLADFQDEIAETLKILNNIFMDMKSGQKKMHIFQIYYKQVISCEKCTYSEIAKSNGLSVATVSNYITEVKKWLAMLLQIRKCIDFRYSKIVYKQVIEKLKDSMKKAAWKNIEKELHQGNWSQELHSIFVQALEQIIAEHNEGISSQQVKEEANSILKTLITK